ncbi:penicillin-binding protein activator [Thalassotalea ganghwensis]
MKFIIKHYSHAPKSVLSLASRISKYILTILALSYLTSCANQKPQPVTQPSSTPSTESAQTKQYSGEELVEQAKAQDSEQAISTLFSAAQRFSNEQQHYQAIWLTELLSSFSLSPQQRYQLALIKLQGFIELSLLAQATQNLQLLQALEQQHQIGPNLTALKLKQQLAELKKQELHALNAQLHAFTIDNSASEELIDNIWYKLARLSNWQADQLALLNPPLYDGWQRLLSYSHQFGHDNATLIRYIALWQQDFPTHPANHIAEQLKANAESTLTPVLKNIAVILPLSGKQELAGRVAQEGLLAAYSNDETLTLHFIDSNQWQLDTLATQFDELAIDYVIGPLLKENVEAYIGLENLSTPTLLLNTVNGVSLGSQHVAFSMRPEDEAIQAASTLSAKQFKHPLVISHNDNASKRIAEQFSATWQKLNEQAPELIYFERGNNMEKILKESLEVEASQARINDLDIRVKQVLKTETRNRRDIDMIYLIGSADETRLLKPYIEVNISPFAKLIPVYASSRSHSGQFDESDSRDLAGLTFTEMPWLLPSQQQNKPLAKLSQQLWPQRSDSLQRIFAMGYDSLGLINKVEAMKSAPYIRHYGQTGVLQLNEQRLLVRSLLWGQYNRDGIESVAVVNK